MSYVANDSSEPNLTDERDFDTLYTQHRDRVYATVSRVTRNSPDAEDLVQVTFLKAYRALSSFRGQAAFSTWLTRIAMNVSLDHLKNQKRKRKTLDLAILEMGEGPDIQERVLRPDEELGKVECRQVLERGLAGLPERYRRVLGMRYLGQLSYRELSQEFDVPVGTMKTWLHRARKGLRQELEKAGVNQRHF